MKYSPINKENWTPVNIAWLAGLIEGEGYIAKSKVFLRIRMTDEDVVKKCMMFKIGYLRGPVEGNSKKNKKPIYEWTVTRKQWFVEILNAIYEHMGERRKERIDAVLKSINKKAA